MLIHLINPRRALFWTVFHILIGFVCTITPWILIVWFYFMLFASMSTAIGSIYKNNIQPFTYLMGYLLGFELLDRMAQTSPYLPYELGKYMLIGFLSLALLLSLKRPYTAGLWMILLISPAAFYDFSGDRQFFDIINNYFGPLGLALGVTLWARYAMTQAQINSLLRLLWFTCLSALVFTVIKTPDFDTIDFNLKANFETTGGHSSNQVATILGFGMFLSFYSWLNRLNFSGYRLIDGLATGAFALQGLLTFSRGGMIVGALAIIFIYILNTLNRSKKPGRKQGYTAVYFGIGLLLLAGVFMQVDKITGGKLTLRYQGETEGTLRGTQEKNLNKITSGRVKIFNEDIDLWLQYPVLGVGAGSSRHIRTSQGETKVAAHLEFSRLLAEHGILGLIYFIMLLKIGWSILRNKNTPMRNILLILFFIALATSFHAAMRTYITPFLLAVSSLNINNREK
jgi:hypothetical protein